MSNGLFDVLAQGKVEMTSETKDKTPEKKGPVKGKGLPLSRMFTDGKTDPMDTVTWEKRDAVIKAEDGTDVFRQEDVEFPSTYSQSATNVIASKYFRGTLGTANREHSVRDMILRVTDTLTRWGRKNGYFADDESSKVFHDELTHLVLHQYGTFNSPVWFNVGVEKSPQCSACFINSVEDTMESILKLAHTEGMLFKFGSGTGTNFSSLRSSRESLSGGGIASGPVSFMKGYDAFAGVIKSGGKTRRAAKMVILNVGHPDIMEFINSKSTEEGKARALVELGYDGSFGGEAYDSVFFQNANHSVRVTDEFMRAVETDGEWNTIAVTTGKPMDTLRARDVMDAISKAAHQCGDPGIQFDTTVNDWHTCPNSGRINASNPCSEFMFLDNSACNLASLNLMKFLREDGSYDTDAMSHAVRMFIMAQEIIVGCAHYPTKEIGENSETYRPLGLGYANLGALLMQWGYPYDSDEGRAIAAAITALMTGEAYVQSAKISSVKGPFAAYQQNREPMLKVIRKHRSALDDVHKEHVPESLMAAAREAWDRALELGEKHGFRNSQTTLLAPTGTIGFKMDCDTTGIEPELAIVKFKNLVGGGTMKIVNQTVPKALEHLGYDEKARGKILDYVNEKDTIEGAPGLKTAHLPVFDCAFKPSGGVRSISVDGHVKMMGAVQPFLSGAISKTVNMPSDSTVQDVADTYMNAWKWGLKAIAIYRDGSKTSQPVVTDKAQNGKKAAEAADEAHPIRCKLPDERQSITHKFSIGGMDGYITVGMYESGMPGEIFVTMAKQGSVISGLMDSFATSVSIALQYGVPLNVLVDKFSHLRFEPSGYSSNPAIGYAKSIIDYIFRWLGQKFITPDKAVSNEEVPDLQAIATDNPQGPAQVDLFQGQEDAPPCNVCGFIMVRNGACYKCTNCGATSGCS